MGKAKKYAWRVTNTDGNVELEFGEKLSASPLDDATKVDLLGRQLVKLGMRLMGSDLVDDDEDDD